MYDKTVRRRRAVLLLLVVSSLALLTAYFGESAGGGLHSVQRGVMSIVSPIQEGASRALKPIRDLFGWIGDTVDAKGDLEKTETDRDQWRKRAIDLEGADRENQQLRAQLNLNKQLGLGEYKPVGARVIGKSPTLWYVRLTIDKGTSAGIRRNMPVLASDGREGNRGEGTGLIGKVTQATSNAAVVTLITDHSIAVTAKTLRSRIDGSIQAEVGSPNDLVMQFTPRGAAVQTREPVVTAGIGENKRGLRSIYPAGLPIGLVVRVEDPNTDSQEVIVRPFVDMKRVEFVQVLTATGGTDG